MTDTSKLIEQRTAIESLRVASHRHLTPVAAPVGPSYSHPSLILQGRKLGCVVMAGGQATRLGSTSPKGVIPFSAVANKPLLQIIAEKVKAYSRCYGIEPRLAIMTSEASDAATRTLFENHQFFGLRSVEFFVQPSLPLLDMTGELITGSDGTVLTGPDGNGSVFAGLMRSGIGEQWEQDGVEGVCLIMVDNPLLDPFCPAIFSPIFEGCDLTAAAIERASAEEQVGLFAIDNKRLCVVEYSEVDPVLRAARDDQGHLVFRWANISFFGCSIPFLKEAAAAPLPLHVAKKKVQGIEVWKSEYFVFDAMSAARTITLIPLEREACFAPIKDTLTLEKARSAMVARDRRRFFELTGVEAEASVPFELSASAFYPSDRFLTWLRGNILRRGFLEEPSESSS